MHWTRKIESVEEIPPRLAHCIVLNLMSWANNIWKPLPTWHHQPRAEKCLPIQLCKRTSVERKEEDQQNVGEVDNGKENMPRRLFFIKTASYTSRVNRRKGKWAFAKTRGMFHRIVIFCVNTSHDVACARQGEGERRDRISIEKSSFRLTEVVLNEWKGKSFAAAHLVLLRDPKFFIATCESLDHLVNINLHVLMGLTGRRLNGAKWLIVVRAEKITFGETEWDHFSHRTELDGAMNRGVVDYKAPARHFLIWPSMKSGMLVNLFVW